MSPALPENVRVLPGVTPSFLTASSVDPDALMPHAFELERIARDIRLAIDAANNSIAAGVPLRSDLVPFLQLMAGQFSYRAGQVEADALEAQGFGGAA